MNQLDGIRVYCEDEDRRPTVRLLFLAFESLKQHVAIAGAIDTRPTGSKEDVKTRVRHARRDRARAFGIRDRDFLPRSILDDLRRKALDGDAKSAEAWPLARHSIESYLLDPPFLAEALPHRSEADWRAVLDDMAAARKWTDLLRATLVDLRWRVSRVEWQSVESRFTTREAALSELASRFAESRSAIETALAEARASAKFESLEQDFEDDGPLPHRVDGKKLLEDLDAALLREGARRARGLKEALLKHAERHGCPNALLSELRPLLVEVTAAHLRWV